MLRGDQLHLADVDVVAGSRQQGLEDKGLGAPGLELAITVDAHFALAGFSASQGRIEKVLRIGD